MSYKHWMITRFFRWLYRVMDGQIVLIDYHVNPSTHRFHETLVYSKLSSAQAIGMGYIRGKKIKDEVAFIPFKIYVRFTPNEAPPLPYTVCDDGSMMPNIETSSTLWDHWRSDSIEKFLNGLTTKKALAPIDQKKLMMIGVIAAGALAGLYILFK